MIREGVARSLREILGIEEVPINVPPRQEMGDFSSAICLSLAKQRRRSPMEIAKETAEQFKSNLPPFIHEIPSLLLDISISKWIGRLWRRS